MFTYKATVVDVYDGDTITCDIDLGFFSHRKREKFRLFGIDTPEMRGPERAEGIVSRDWLREKVLGKEIILKSQKDHKGKYGRWLATIYEKESDEVSLNQQLIDLGLAKAATY